MSEHPYRAPATDVARRAKSVPWTIALVVLWIVAAARALAVVFDHSLAGPIGGLSIALAIFIPVIAVNARVLAGSNDE